MAWISCWSNLSWWWMLSILSERGCINWFACLSVWKHGHCCLAFSSACNLWAIWASIFTRSLFACTFLSGNRIMFTLPWLISSIFWKKPTRILPRILWLVILVELDPWMTSTLRSNWCTCSLDDMIYHLSSLR